MNGYRSADDDSAVAQWAMGMEAASWMSHSVCGDERVSVSLESDEYLLAIVIWYILKLHHVKGSIKM